jgi:hypothetical protein
MTVDRSLCAICAWKGDCNKKFMRGSGVYCPDYTRDVSIRERVTEKKVAEKPKNAKGKKKKASNFRFM